MSQNLFTAAQIAGAITQSKRSVLEALQRIRPSGIKIIEGNEARTWAKNVLPQKILGALEEAAARRRTDVERLLASPSPLWRPPCPLSELTEEAVERASLLQHALSPTL